MSRERAYSAGILLFRERGFAGKILVIRDENSLYLHPRGYLQGICSDFCKKIPGSGTGPGKRTGTLQAATIGFYQDTG